MTHDAQGRTSASTRWTWSLGACAAGVGFALRYGGWPEAIMPWPVTHGVRPAFLIALGLFVLSRCLMLLPIRHLRTRFAHWWVDYVLLAGAAIWWKLAPHHETALLEIAGLYIAGLWLGFVCLRHLAALVRLCTEGLTRGIGLRLFAAALFVAVAGAVALTLPVAWDGPYPVAWEATYPAQTRYELSLHALDALFTATAALTGTGLGLQDLDRSFSSTGQATILILIEIGGLAFLALGTCAGLSLRRLLGWQAADDDFSRRGFTRLLTFIITSALLLQLAGATALLGSAYLGGRIPPGGWPPAVWHSVFLSASAFFNVGLTLGEGSLIPLHQTLPIFSVLLPLMVLGTLGGPLLYELFRRATLQGGLKPYALSTHARYAIAMLVIVTLLSAAGLWIAESTIERQLRFPRDDTPGRLLLANAASHPATAASTPPTTQRAPAQRLRAMGAEERFNHALFLAVAARGGGFWTARLDELSLTPAGYVVLMMGMAVGGAVGGTTGGWPLLAVLLVMACMAIRRRPRPRVPHRLLADERETAAFYVSMACIIVLAGLWALTSLVLIYREAASPLACMFESASACFNVGFTTGMTPALSIAGRVTLILAMLISRVALLALLARSLAYGGFDFDE